MKKARYQVINGFQTLDEDGDWSNGYSKGDVLWRIIGTNKFEDEDGNFVIFSQKDIKDYVVKVGQRMKTEELIKAKKYIEHVIGTIKHDGHLGTIQTDLILPDLEKALAAIGGDK